MSQTAATFVFDKDYDNVEQVRPFFTGYLAVRANLDDAGQYPYNDSFTGKISGIEGPSEDTAIYLLQKMYDLDALALKVEEFLASGGEHVTEMTETLRGTIVVYGFYMGGTGWSEHREARLLARNGKPYAILPKGKRTNGHSVTGRVMFRKES